MKRIALASVLALPLGAPAYAQQATTTGTPASTTTAPASGHVAAAPAPGAEAAAVAKKQPAEPAAPAPAAPAQPTPAAPATAPKAATSTAPAPAPAAPAVTLAPKALAVKPGHYRLDPDHGKITWSVNHLGFSTYAGQFGTVAADIVIDPKDVSKTTLTASVDVNSVATLNSKLDDALKGEEWFDAKTYGQATFKANTVTVTGPQTARIDGDLTLHGKTGPIVLSATFNNAGVDPVDKQYTVGFDAAAIIRRSVFGITKDVPFVGDNVTLRLEGEFKLVPAP